MYELHDREQYFFDEATLDHLVRFVSAWRAPCCLCAPLLGKRLSECGVDVTILDIDERFADSPGFHRYDICRPQWLGAEFDLIFCDPPFFNVSLSQLLTAVRTLARNDFQQQLVVSYLQRRGDAIIGTFSPFGISPTGYCPTYQTVRDTDKNRIELFTSLPEEQIEALKKTHSG